jgi:uncharacterized membrane protein YdbT with pleckstrin-like domain
LIAALERLDRFGLVISSQSFGNYSVVQHTTAAGAFIGISAADAIWVKAIVADLFRQWITEIAVTDRRIIYKRGFIRRVTAEMNMDKVESVDVTQSILGRLLDYGSIHVRGTGEGIEHLHNIAHPVDLRNCITAR